MDRQQQQQQQQQQRRELMMTTATTTRRPSSTTATTATATTTPLFEEDCVQAQRAVVESVRVGQETLKQAHAQGEQLERTDSLADETQYQLDKAARLLRGMTWTGWVANMFTKEGLVGSHSQKTSTNANTTRSNALQQKDSLLFEDDDEEEASSSSSFYPPSCQVARQAIQNYHANVQVMENEAETYEQHQVLHEICETMYKQTMKDIQAIHTNTNTRSMPTQQQQHPQNAQKAAAPPGAVAAYKTKLQKHVDDVRKRQLRVEQQYQQQKEQPQQRQQQQQPQHESKSFFESCNSQQNTDLKLTAGRMIFNDNNDDDQQLFANNNHCSGSTNGTMRPPQKNEAQQHPHSPLPFNDTSSSQQQQQQQQLLVHQQQDEHLEFLSKNLGQLDQIAHSLQTAIHSQTDTLDRIDTKSESILEQSKHVTRRADRLSQSKAWLQEKPVFCKRVRIMHVPSRKYLGCIQQEVYLLPRYHKESCLFSLYKRKNGNLVGFRQVGSHKWLGQALLGSLTCSATSMGRREEWELDDKNYYLQDASANANANANASASVEIHTRLLCASAGWGAGGYLMVRDRDHAISIGSAGVQEKQKAAMFILVEQLDD